MGGGRQGPALAAPLPPAFAAWTSSEPEPGLQGNGAPVLEGSLQGVEEQSQPTLCGACFLLQEAFPHIGVFKSGSSSSACLPAHLHGLWESGVDWGGQGQVRGQKELQRGLPRQAPISSLPGNGPDTALERPRSRTPRWLTAEGGTCPEGGREMRSRQSGQGESQAAALSTLTWEQAP